MINFSQILDFPSMQIVFLSNTVAAWLLALLVFFASLIVLKIFRSVLVAKLRKITRKTKTEIDDIIVNAIQAIHWPFYILVSIYVAINFLAVHFLVQQWTYYVFLVVVIYYTIKVLQRFVDFGAKSIIKRRKDRESKDTEVIKLLSSIIKVSIWLVAIVLLLANLGYDVTSLIAGLGIGGIAVALALQNVLGDIFSSVSIYFDKPFRVGDFVAVGDQMGTVKKIGIKTTRVEVPQGEELVIANSELTKSQVRNFGVMEKRRGLAHIGVAYNTPAEKLEKIPEMIRKIINNQDNTEADRIHFKSFADSSLIYEVVYYVNSGEYVQFMDIQQAINLAIIKKFEQEKIEIAFPTQTIYLKK